MQKHGELRSDVFDINAAYGEAERARAEEDTWDLPTRTRIHITTTRPILHHPHPGV